MTGAEDIVHNHRMRALFDAVVVGAGTVRHDDPQLTVRAVPGPHPVRVVLDPRRRLGAAYRVFNDAAAPTLLLCAAALAAARRAARAGRGARCRDPGRQPLPARGARSPGRTGLSRVFIEGGGVTVSRFLAAGCLHRLQITIAPLIIGSGRPSITLPEIERVERRPQARSAPPRCSARTSCSNAASMAEARAFWVTAPGRGELRAERLARPGPGEVLVEALASGISRGTETLVFRGRVPASQHQLMRAPFQAGEFALPIKYGYSSVGLVRDGVPELRDRRVFCLHPHQDRYVVPAGAVVPVPDGVPDARAVLAANMETALNGLWDAAPRIGDRVAVIGAGVVGALAAALLARIPGSRGPADRHRSGQSPDRGRARRRLRAAGRRAAATPIW